MQFTYAYIQCNLYACLHPSYELNEFGKRYNNAGRMYCLLFFIAKIWQMVDMEKFYDPNFDLLCGFHNQYQRSHKYAKQSIK